MYFCRIFEDFCFNDRFEIKESYRAVPVVSQGLPYHFVGPFISFRGTFHIISRDF